MLGRRPSDGVAKIAGPESITEPEGRVATHVLRELHARPVGRQVALRLNFVNEVRVIRVERRRQLTATRQAVGHRDTASYTSTTGCPTTAIVRRRRWHVAGRRRTHGGKQAVQIRRRVGECLIRKERGPSRELCGEPDSSRVADALDLLQIRVVAAAPTTQSLRQWSVVLSTRSRRPPAASYSNRWADRRVGLITEPISAYTSSSYAAATVAVTSSVVRADASARVPNRPW